MDRRHKCGGEGIGVKEEQDLIPMNIMSQPDDPVLFTINEAEWSGMTSSPLLTPRPTKYNQQESVFSFSEDGSLSSCSNAGFQDYQRQESNIHTRFDSDTAFLFSNQRNRRFHARKRLAAVWCATCVFQIWQYMSRLCTFDCSCRDQLGVHCLYRLKQKAMKKLKVVQGALCVVTAIQSCMVFIPLGNITANFDGQCLLYSNLFIHWMSRNDTVALDLTRSKFGNKEDCNFTTFINVVVALVSLLFIWFFIHTSFVSDLEHVEGKLQCPFFLCSLVLLVSVIVSSFKITIGFNSWCYNIIINNPFKTDRQRLKCKDFENLKWSTDNRSNFYTYFVLAEISTWMLTLTLVLQLSVNALHLYQNFKVTYAEIEVLHVKLKNSSGGSDDEQPDWELDDLQLSLCHPVAPLPVYKVEYKKHQVLAKVIVHRDKAVNLFHKFDANSTFIIDKEKFKRNISSFERFDGLKAIRKVDFPLKVEPGRRRRQNWTGSCEELHSGIKFGNHFTRNVTIRSHEWHGFDTDINIPDENGQAGTILDWHADFGSQIHKLWPNSFEWPVISHSNRQMDGHVISHEWHGFENDFVSHHKKSSSLPADWQHFDSDLGNQTDHFKWSDQDVSTNSRNEDPWDFEQYQTSGEIQDNNRNEDLWDFEQHQASGEIHDNSRNEDLWDFEQHRTSEEIHDNSRASEDNHSCIKDDDNRSNTNVYDDARDPFESEKR